MGNSWHSISYYFFTFTLYKNNIRQVKLLTQLRYFDKINNLKLQRLRKYRMYAKWF